VLSVHRNLLKIIDDILSVIDLEIVTLKRCFDILFRSLSYREPLVRYKMQSTIFTYSPFYWLPLEITVLGLTA
jgi:hypothetical protein